MTVASDEARGWPARIDKKMSVVVFKLLNLFLSVCCTELGLKFSVRSTDALVRIKTFDLCRSSSNSGHRYYLAAWLLLVV